MKKSLILATAVFVLGFGISLVAKFMDYASFNVLSVSAAAGGVFVSSLILIACNDYARKPRFRVRSSRSAEPSNSATPTNIGPACDWTYTTRFV
jgi:hypothetical protein